MRHGSDQTRGLTCARSYFLKATMSLDLRSGRDSADLMLTRQAVALDRRRPTIEATRDALGYAFGERDLKTVRPTLRRRNVAGILEACEGLFTFARSLPHKLRGRTCQ